MNQYHQGALNKFDWKSSHLIDRIIEWKPHFKQIDHWYMISYTLISSWFQNQNHNFCSLLFFLRLLFIFRVYRFDSKTKAADNMRSQDKVRISKGAHFWLPDALDIQRAISQQPSRWLQNLCSLLLESRELFSRLLCIAVPPRFLRIDLPALRTGRHLKTIMVQVKCVHY